MRLALAATPSSRYRAALCCALVAAVSACSFVGETQVRVESGNQTTGYLSRPLTLTPSSDASVDAVAQRTCNGVKPGSVAEVTFVGKVPAPDPISLGDWGRYQYTCVSSVPARPAAAAAPAALPAPPPPAPAAPLTDAQEQRRRECLRQQGNYQICMGTCLASSASPSILVEAECTQRCAPKAPTACN